MGLAHTSLIALLASAGALKLAPSRTSRMSMSLAGHDSKKLVGANGELLDCIAAAANGAEIEECELAYSEAFDATGGMSDSTTTREVAAPSPLSSKIDGKALAGANGELLDCIAAAADGREIEECELSFESSFKSLDESS